MRRFTAGPGDIVVIVPRWIMVVVGLAMMLVGLTIAFNFVLQGFVQEGLLYVAAAAVMVPLNLLILYIVWRFYWYILALSLLAGSVLFVLMITGMFRVVGLPAVFASRFIDAFLLAVIVVGLLALVIFTFIMPRRQTAYDVDTLDRPMPRRRKRRDLWAQDQPERYPHPHDAYWDDE